MGLLKLTDKELELIVGKTSCVVPVTAADALAWVTGKLNDNDLLLRSCLVPEAVFLLSFADRHFYRVALKAIAYWQQRGAVCMIMRTGNPAVELHISKIPGSIRYWTEQTDPPMHRFMVPPATFSTWVSKWSRPHRKRLTTGQPEAKL